MLESTNLSVAMHMPAYELGFFLSQNSSSASEFKFAIVIVIFLEVR